MENTIKGKINDLFDLAVIAAYSRCFFSVLRSSSLGQTSCLTRLRLTNKSLMRHRIISPDLLSSVSER